MLMITNFRNLILKNFWRFNSLALGYYDESPRLQSLVIRIRMFWRSTFLSELTQTGDEGHVYRGFMESFGFLFSALFVKLPRVFFTVVRVVLVRPGLLVVRVICGLIVTFGIWFWGSVVYVRVLVFSSRVRFFIGYAGCVFADVVVDVAFDFLARPWPRGLRNCIRFMLVAVLSFLVRLDVLVWGIYVRVVEGYRSASIFSYIRCLVLGPVVVFIMSSAITIFIFVYPVVEELVKFVLPALVKKVRFYAFVFLIGTPAVLLCTLADPLILLIGDLHRNTFLGRVFTEIYVFVLAAIVLPAYAIICSIRRAVRFCVVWLNSNIPLIVHAVFSCFSFIFMRAVVTPSFSRRGVPCVGFRDLFRGIGCVGLFATFMLAFTGVCTVYTEFVDSWAQLFNGTIHMRPTIYGIGDFWGHPEDMRRVFRGLLYTYFHDPLMWMESGLANWSWYLHELLRQSFAPDGFSAGSSYFFRLLTGILEDPDVISGILAIGVLFTYAVFKDVVWSYRTPISILQAFSSLFFYGDVFDMFTGQPEWSDFVSVILSCVVVVLPSSLYTVDTVRAACASLLCSVALLLDAGSAIEFFVLIELMGVLGFVLIVSSNFGRGRVAAFRYLVFNSVGSFALLLGMVVLYWQFGSLELDAAHAVFGAESPSMVNNIIALFFVAGLVAKFISVPLVITTQSVFSRQTVAEILVLVVVVETTYAAVGVDLIVACFNTAWFTTYFVLNILSLLCVIFSGLAAIQSQSKVVGLLYSSAQHVGTVLGIIALSAGSEVAVTSALYYFITYFSTVLVTFLLLRFVDSDTSTDYRSVRVAAGVILAFLFLSLAGVPPFIGFYSKIFMMVAAIDAGAYFTLVTQILSGGLAFVYYGRLFLDIWSSASDFWGEFDRDISLFGISGAILLRSWVWLAVAVSVWFSFVLVFTFIPIVDIASVQLLSPYFRAVEHRSALLNSAWSFVGTSYPNAHIPVYSWQALQTMIPAYHPASWTGAYDMSNYGNMRTRLTPPFDTALLPKYDSRYFWLGEWLMYPWQFVPGRTFDVGGVARDIFRPIAPEYRDMVYRYHMARGIPWSFFNAQTAPFLYSEPFFTLASNILLEKSYSGHSSEDLAVANFAYDRAGNISLPLSHIHGVQDDFDRNLNEALAYTF